MEYTSTLTEQDVRVSGIAGERFQRLISGVEDDDIEAIRIYVAGGGCSGMTYGMTFTDRRTDYDRVYEGDGYRIYVDAVALNYLRGVEIDFVEKAIRARPSCSTTCSRPPAAPVPAARAAWRAAEAAAEDNAGPCPNEGRLGRACAFGQGPRTPGCANP